MHADQPVAELDRRRARLIAVIGAQRAVDADGAPAFAADLEHVIDAGATRVVVDLRRAGLVGTLGLNALLRARQQLLDSGGRIAVVLPPRLRRLFGLLHLDRRFLLAADTLQALRLVGVTPEARPRPPQARAA